MTSSTHDRHRETLASDAATVGESAAKCATDNHFNTADYLVGKYGLTLTPTQVGEVMHHHPSHIRSLCAQGELPGVHIGNRWAIPAAKLAAIIDGATNSD